MKSGKYGLVFMIIASICYLVAFLMIMMIQKAYDFYFYLQLVVGVVFFIIAWRTYFVEKKKKEGEEKKVISDK